VRAAIFVLLLGVAACGTPDDCPALPYAGLPCTHVCEYWEGQIFDCVDGMQVPRCSSTNQQPCDMGVALDLSEAPDLAELADGGND
jgi:hypothetical protein